MTEQKRLAPGDPAPEFDAWEFRGERRIRQEDYLGRRLLLSFYRYASCPLCNLRVHTLAEHGPHWKRDGLDLLGVFQSPAERMRDYVGTQSIPFPLIADPEQRLYAAYGVGHSWAGFLKAWATRLLEIRRSTLGLGYLPGSVEGNINRIPADFLIDRGGRIVEAYYGRDIGDHLPLDRIMQFVAAGRDG